LPFGLFRRLIKFFLYFCGAGAEVLHKFADYLQKPETDELKHERMCLDFSNKWWSLVHTTRPFVISDIETLAETVSELMILNYL
jgi:hypothetical protein